MRHFASPGFWAAYTKLPEQVRKLADRNCALLKEDPQHPSLHLKKAGRFWAVRVGRSLSKPKMAFLWFWIGSHSDYDAMIR